MRQAWGIRTALDASFEAVRGRLAACGCGRAEFDWAACLMNSRCFATAVGGRVVHLAVPGIDMCNHERDAPSALIRSIITLTRLDFTFSLISLRCTALTLDPTACERPVCLSGVWPWEQACHRAHCC